MKHSETAAEHSKDVELTMTYLASHVATVERWNCLERIFGYTAEEHAADLGNVKAMQGKRKQALGGNVKGFEVGVDAPRIGGPTLRMFGDGCLATRPTSMLRNSRRRCTPSSTGWWAVARVRPMATRGAT